MSSLPAEKLGGIVGAASRWQFRIRGGGGDSRRWRHHRRIRRQRILDTVAAVDQLQRCLQRNSELKKIKITCKIVKFKKGQKKT
jgi:hypothetical protein